MGKMSSCGCLLDLVFVFDCKRSLVSADVESRSAVIVVAPLVARPDGRATVMKIWPRPHDSFLSFAQRPQRAGETVEPRLSPSRKFIIIGEPGDEARETAEEPPRERVRKLLITHL